MKAMNYTNLILTFIAGCLFMLVLQQLHLFPEVHAGRYEVNPYRDILPVDENGNLKVSLSNLEEIDVNISGISTFDELDVNIKELEDGPIRVEVE